MATWNHNSGVLPCTECDGHGTVCTTPHYTHASDPRRNDVPCPDCDGVGHHACKVCGFDILVPGYDCIVCQTAVDLPMEDGVADEFGWALTEAMKARRAHA